MSPLVLAIDQGSSSSRCVAFDARLQPVAAASRPLATSYPGPGRVEHDAAEIVGGVLCCLREALAAAGAGWPDVAAVGIAAQTETFVVWDARTGDAVHPAISWRDTRTADAIRELRASGHEAVIRSVTGLPLEAAFSASKLSWLLDELPGARQAAASGRLLFGDIGCWLTWHLSGGAAHVTDWSMASRTMLFDLAAGSWDQSLIDLFGIPEQMLPKVVPTAGRLAVTDASVCSGWATIAAIAGDQQAGLFGHRCLTEGMAKLTMGTGAFVWCNAGARTPGSALAVPAGVVSTCAWRIGEQTTYALEGFVPNAGSVTTWLRRLGVLGAADWPAVRPGALARAASPVGREPWCVPALFGLGTPTWAPVAAADMGGLAADSAGTDIAEAAMIGVAHQIVDALEAVRVGLSGPLGVVRVDGGLGRNDSVLQAIADLSGLCLERTDTTEVTALGAGALSGLGAGLWDLGTVAGMPGKADRTAAPLLPATAREAARNTWRRRLADVIARAGETAP
jgi:glycerol kinase